MVFGEFYKWVLFGVVIRGIARLERGVVVIEYTCINEHWTPRMR